MENTSGKRTASSTTTARSRLRPGRKAPGSHLDGRIALVTGASGGLGASIASRLHREGCRLVVSGRREAELARLASALGGGVRTVRADLAFTEDVRRLAEQAGDVDVLVANAGLPANGDLADLSVEDICRAVDLNVRSTIVLTRLLLPAMLARGSGPRRHRRFAGGPRRDTAVLDLQRQQVRPARLRPRAARGASRDRRRGLAGEPHLRLRDGHVGRHRPARPASRGHARTGR